ncbi:MAG: metallophosphoesterase [Thomasclavelia sp.]|nr:metallophosphoesterase [Thomasclavelia sp.]
MKVMILSDSHFLNKHDLLEILHQQKCNYYIHCGDIYMPFEGLGMTSFYNVRGNNDGHQIPIELNLEIDHLNFYVTHGHLYDVDFTLDNLLDYAKDNNKDVVLFGHTHRPTYEIIDDIIFINPGSLSFPRGKYRKPTYAIFDTQSKNVTFYDASTGEMCDPFTKENKEKKGSFFSRLFK